MVLDRFLRWKIQIYIQIIIQSNPCVCCLIFSFHPFTLNASMSITFTTNAFKITLHCAPTQPNCDFSKYFSYRSICIVFRANPPNLLKSGAKMPKVSQNFLSKQKLHYLISAYKWIYLKLYIQENKIKTKNISDSLEK